MALLPWPVVWRCMGLAAEAARRRGLALPAAGAALPDRRRGLAFEAGAALPVDARRRGLALPAAARLLAGRPADAAGRDPPCRPAALALPPSFALPALAPPVDLLPAFTLPCGMQGVKITPYRY